MPIPHDYVERVYAGVLGKIIGVYLGRPFEGWKHTDILERLGEIDYYVHERRNVPLIVSDDDITGTFTFIRALEDYGYCKDLTPAQIGQTWLNYIIENKTILWWGGMGTSTEHTAFLRLKRGIPAPRSGSMELNSKVVAEQIGSQIFIDGWAMVAPGDPALAADLAKRAASVSHDGEAIYGAQVIAAMESQAFVEKDLSKLLDTAVGFIPKSSTIYRLIDDLRNYRAKESDWHEGLSLIHEKYSYEKFGGGCHMVPNHAIIMLGLLWGEDDFQRSLMITNTAGYDTDCNSGNVGCLLGIKNGLAGIDNGPDWRGPVADRILLPTADGGRCITDAVTETYHLVRAGYRLACKKVSGPKNGARFHFELPGSVQGFVPQNSVECKGVLRLENVAGQSKLGARSLAMHYEHLALGRFARAATQTFVSPEEAKRSGGYSILSSPTLYSGQTVSAGISADQSNASSVIARLYLRHFDGKDELSPIHGPSIELSPNQATELKWIIPPTDGQSIAEVGIELSSLCATNGTVYLDYLTWSGAPNTVLKKPAAGGQMWTSAWTDGLQGPMPRWHDTWIQNEGRGLLIQGTRDWTDYTVSTEITPHMVKAAGLAARVQGMQRYYAVLLCNDGTAKLIKMLDGETILAKKDFRWEFTRPYQLSLTVQGNRVIARVGDQLQLEAIDDDRPLNGGAIAIVCEEGRGKNGPVTIQPA
jgi:ADP-ribosylglycohydrolase